MTHSTWKSPIVPEVTYTMEQAFGGKGLHYTAPNGRVFQVWRVGTALEARPADNPDEYSYWTIAGGNAWECMKQSIDFDNPKH